MYTASAIMPQNVQSVNSAQPETSGMASLVFLSVSPVIADRQDWES